MPELIYKQEALDKLKYMYLLIERDRGQGCEVAKGLRKACRAISDIKAVDTESVRHGLWIYGGYDEYPTCSCCKQSDTYAGDYCGNCGARMDVTDTNDGKGGNG